MKQIERIPALDMAKCVMAILVVAIHVEPFSGDLAFYYNNCLARIADPMFFAISAYCLIAKCRENHWEKSVFILYMKRIAMLYAGWTVIYLPWIITFCLREAKAGSQVIWLGFMPEKTQWMALLFQKILFAGPFGPLWFLTALLFAMPIVYLLASREKAWVGVALGLPFYGVTVLWMGYRSCVPEDSVIAAVAHIGENVFGWLANGLYYGLFFCALGACAAMYGKCPTDKKKPDIHKINRKQASYGILTLLSAALLVVECSYIRRTGCGVSYGAMFSLIPLTWLLLIYLVNTRWKDRAIFRHLCKMSTLIFVLHYGVMTALDYLWPQRMSSGRADCIARSWGVSYWLVLGITIALGELLLRLSKQRHFRWLRWLM